MTYFSELINSEKPVLVDFFAEWCGPCKTMAPILKDVKSKLGENVTIIKVDIDKNQEASQKYNIRSVPTLILFKNGKEIWKQSGVVPAEALIQVINSR